MRRLTKLLRIVPRLLYAFFGGVVVRAARRLLRRPPRIWHGFTPLFFTAAHVAADRRAGFPARSVVRHARLRDYALVRAEEFDVVYEGVDQRGDESHWNCLIDLLRHADIWYTHFESLFFRYDQARWNDAAMALVKLAGIRIIVTPHGGDILHKHRHVTRFDWIGRAQIDYPNWDLVAQREVAAARIDLFCRWADVVIGGDSSLVRMLPRKDLFFPSVSVDVDTIRPVAVPPRDVPRIVHAPNHRKMKGTDYLLEAVERLRARGIACELVLVEKVPRTEALAIYAQADIVADQFIIGGWGVFALEGMALGKPVMTYLDEQSLGDPVFNQPVVNTNPLNLERVLAALLLVPELRARLGQAGRASVERYHSPQAFADVWARIYRHVWWGDPLRLEETALFDPGRTSRAFTEDPEEEAFWPVPVGDLIDQIRAAIERNKKGAV